MSDLPHEIPILFEKSRRVPQSLPQLSPVIRIPGPALLDDVQVLAQVDQFPRADDPLAIDDVYLGLAERGSELVLDYFDDRLVPNFNLVVADAVLDAPDTLDL